MRQSLTQQQRSDCDEFQYLFKRSPISLQKIEARDELFKLTRKWREVAFSEQRHKHVEQIAKLLTSTIDHPTDKHEGSLADRVTAAREMRLDPWQRRWQSEVRLGPLAVSEATEILLFEAQAADNSQEIRTAAMQELCRLGFTFGDTARVFNLWKQLPPTAAESPTIQSLDWYLIGLRHRAIISAETIKNKLN